MNSTKIYYAYKKLSFLESRGAKAVMEILSEGPMTVTDIQESIKSSECWNIRQPYLSSLLCRLRKYNFLQRSRQGKFRVYSLNESELQGVTESISQFYRS